MKIQSFCEGQTLFPLVLLWHYCVEEAIFSPSSSSQCTMPLFFIFISPLLLQFTALMQHSCSPIVKHVSVPSSTNSPWKSYLFIYLFVRKRSRGIGIKIIQFEQKASISPHVLTVVSIFWPLHQTSIVSFSENIWIFSQSIITIIIPIDLSEWMNSFCDIFIYSSSASSACS